MFHKSDEAIHSLSVGEFEKAKSLYSVLLDKDPDDLDNISGYFVASFWDNRLDLVLRTREGKERGKLLLEYFSVFELESKKRNIQQTIAYSTGLRCILEEASSHLKLAYRWEGANALDTDSLTELAICLIKIGDYKTALEILPFSEGGSRISPHIQFYLAEAYCMVGREKEGKEIYLSAFLEDPGLFPYELVSYPPLRALIDEAKSTVKEEEICEYVPVLAWKKKLFLSEKMASPEEVKVWQKELNRLQEARKRGSGNEFKVRCRMEQYAFAIIEKAPQNLFRDAILQAKNILSEF
jgi:tetratricopeptide (TPR) repeat protein